MLSSRRQEAHVYESANRGDSWAPEAEERLFPRASPNFSALTIGRRARLTSKRRPISPLLREGGGLS